MQMTEQQQEILFNGTWSSIVGFGVSFLLDVLLPWTLHTIGGVLSGIVVSYAVYKFMKWVRKREKSKERQA
jgi:predicted RND superfamily exporter protein